MARERGRGAWRRPGARLRYDFLPRTADRQRGPPHRHRPPRRRPGGDGAAEPAPGHRACRGWRAFRRCGDSIIRPLLETSRQEIEAYLAKPPSVPRGGRDKPGHRPDAGTCCGREVMPLLAELHDGAAANICRTAELLAAGGRISGIRWRADYLPAAGLTAVAAAACWTAARGAAAAGPAPAGGAAAGGEEGLRRRPLSRRWPTCSAGGGLLTLPAGACGRVPGEHGRFLPPQRPPLAPVVLPAREELLGRIHNFRCGKPPEMLVSGRSAVQWF